jgi:integrase
MRRLDSEKFAPLSLAKPFGMGRSKVWLYAITAIRFLALTGFRRGEVLGLRWAEVDIGRRTATLTETKTGKSVRPLSHTACDLLSKPPRKGDLIFPASRGGGQMTGFPKLWVRIAKQAALPVDVTPHVLRHSFASLAADLGYSEPTIAALVGHKRRTVTSRYVHSADAVLLQAADAVSDRIAELMGERRTPGVVVELPKRA